MENSLRNEHPFPIKATARLGGALYLVIILAGIFGEMFVRNRLFVPLDPAATALNISSSPLLWRIGICVDILMHLCDIPVMVVLYLLLKGVNRNLALLNLTFNIIQTSVLTVNKLTLVMPLFLTGDAEYLKTFEPAQLQTLSYLFIKLHDYGFAVGLIFFGFVCITEGYLLRKSPYFPSLLGIMMQIAGVCYLVNSFSLLLYPKLTSMMFPFILLPCLIAECSLSLYMLIKGVRDPS